jgi:hypothetical protein
VESLKPFGRSIRIAFDSSGHGLHRRFRVEPKRDAGVIGRAVTLDGVSDFVDVGRPGSFGSGGSMTITAWINAASLPVDDAAIVSQLQGFQDHALGSGFGYQLDTTVDTGPRTIGFKLTDACGYLMARYVGHSAPHEDLVSRRGGLRR